MASGFGCAGHPNFSFARLVDYQHYVSAGRAVILILHNHYDHLDYATAASICQLSPSAKFVVPLGFYGWFRAEWTLVDADAQLHDFDWHKTIQYKRYKEDGGSMSLWVQSVPMRHWTKRTGDRDQTLWGDTAQQQPQKVATKSSFVSPEIRCGLMARYWKRAWAVHSRGIPIGALEPRGLMKANHVDFPEAMRLKDVIQEEEAVPIRWEPLRSRSSHYWKHGRNWRSY